MTLRTKALIAVAVIAVLAGGCTSAASKAAPAPSHRAATTGPLVAPPTSYAQDAAYFQDLSKTDPSLTSYVNSNQEVALQALLTDGSAFCAFLKRGGGVDNAMASVVVGAKSVEADTQLPTSVATFNAIDAVAIIDLCPTEQGLLPAVDRTHIQSLSRSLSGTTGVSDN